ncbi:hypothetical protein GCM10028773_21530 [Spirosoma koreense]
MPDNEVDGFNRYLLLSIDWEKPMARIRATIMYIGENGQGKLKILIYSILSSNFQKLYEFLDNDS